MLNEEEYTKEQINQDLYFMYKAGLVDIQMREDGEWIYTATEYAKGLTSEQLDEIFSSSYDEE
jgi:DNA-binding transcriptional ArsR family regulator